MERAPTQQLVLDVLELRCQLGERSWTFPDRVLPQLRALASEGLLRHRSAPTQRCQLAWLTDAGYETLDAIPRLGPLRGNDERPDVDVSHVGADTLPPGQYLLLEYAAAAWRLHLDRLDSGGGAVRRFLGGLVKKGYATRFEDGAWTLTDQGIAAATSGRYGAIARQPAL